MKKKSLNKHELYNINKHIKNDRKKDHLKAQ